MRRVGWSHVTIALALIAALAIAAPAIGGPSLKKLVKKEVSKQIAKATGPAGPPGANGTNGVNGVNGVNGTDGTARAYAAVDPLDCDDLTDVCELDESKGVLSAVRLATGQYCVTASGISAEATPAAVTVDWEKTSEPEGNASAMTQETLSCGPTTGGFRVVTARIPDTGGAAAFADDVGFTIVIP